MEKMEIITIPDGQTKIAKNAFRWRRSLYGVNIPDSVTIIEKNAFYECINLQNIIMPDSVTVIEKNAFYGCKKLQNITMSKNITSIGDYAFYWCRNLAGIVLPDSLVSIGNYAFSWCKNLTVFCSASQILAQAYCRKNKIKIQLIESMPPMRTDNISKIKEEPEKPINNEIAGLSYIEKKINAFIGEINLFENSVANTGFSGELTEIKNILNKIIILWKDEKDSESRSKQLDDFINYYFPTIKKILDTYSQIEKNNLNGVNAAETKHRISEAIPFIKRAFEKQLDNMYQNKMFDITTDIDALESMLAKDGLIDSNPFEIKKL